MARFTKESIQRLRDAVDIVEVISRSIHLKKIGGSLKGLCPFHSEKTPSFTVHRSSQHYHCFGCGVHGDSLSFLMNYEGMGFTQALLFLSERFQVPLEEELLDGKSVSHDEIKKSRLKLLLEKAAYFFHAMLLYSDEAFHIRSYLLQRSLSYSYVKNFLLGYSPNSLKGASSLQRYLQAHQFSQEEMIQAGVIAMRREGAQDFFSGRIMFPILDQMGSIIGFSARKVDEKTYGGKYINTAETQIFKKSRVLFGLFYSKRRIVKERNVILVEGQLDALRLIHSGFDYAVATLGTAFGEVHIDVLKTLGVENAYLAFDSDEAGIQSAIKAGHLLMKRGISVFHLDMGFDKDPDAFILRKGRSQFLQRLLEAPDHVQFSLLHAQKRVNWSSGSEREKSLRRIVEEIKEWNNPLLERESIGQLALLAQVPIEFLQDSGAGIETGRHVEKRLLAPKVHVLQKIDTKRPISVQEDGIAQTIDSDTELELDLLRWLLAIPNETSSLREKFTDLISQFDFATAIGRKFFEALLQIQKIDSQQMSLIYLAGEIDCNDVEEAYIQYMVRKPSIRIEKLHQHIYEAIQKLKERRWLIERESVKNRIEEGLSESEQIRLLEEFSSIKAPALPPLEQLIQAYSNR